ncbi:HSF-type DNA-binding domain-containing protein [Rhizoctonia solani AG-1 IA]|uniref:HSF-type DNA-binding domain-containing protein n=1 Tax=Thanatephorus cucumeris (strain AG1-IA) TaxID=983506 RepID=L8WWJ2_THACA|nr:HSF-type DNA-binding domain-containing protein [Rhizoctonia solani AG-1 IA]
MMKDFALHYRNAPAVSSFAPKAGELVAAKFSGDGQWYRAKVKRSSAAKKEVELTFVDYGNQETAPFSNTRPLDPRFKTLSPQAQDARLSFVKLAGPDTEYAEDAIGRFRSLAESEMVDFSHKNHYITGSANVISRCLGLAMIDKKERYLASYPGVVNALKDATLSAKRERLGMYELEYARCYVLGPPPHSSAAHGLASHMVLLIRAKTGLLRPDNMAIRPRDLHTLMRDRARITRVNNFGYCTSPHDKEASLVEKSLNSPCTYGLSTRLQTHMAHQLSVQINTKLVAYDPPQDRRPYPPDTGLGYSTSWPSYETTSLLPSGSDSTNLALPGSSSTFQLYPSSFEPSFQLPDTTYPTPPPTGAVGFEPNFQQEFFGPPPPADVHSPFMMDAPKPRPIHAPTGVRNNTLAIRSRQSQPHLRTQLSIPSPFPAYRSIQSFPVNIPHSRQSSSSSPTDDVPPSIRRHSADRVSKPTPNLSEVIVPTEEESTAFISKLYHILSRPEYSKYLAWNESGDAFLLMNATEFAQQVLPRFFRHSNISSFVRQLRLYGFTRVSTIRLLQLADQSDHPAAADLVAQANASPSFQSASGFARVYFLIQSIRLVAHCMLRSFVPARRKKPFGTTEASELSQGQAGRVHPQKGGRDR